ncbi:MAG TPA: hypothetical protein VFB12_15940 [Ktedonobacteraceae bacterium]|nr:hypothetical protein [Ktedonobacteraceae bacterium]
MREIPGRVTGEQDKVLREARSDDHAGQKTGPAATLKMVLWDQYVSA